MPLFMIFYVIPVIILFVFVLIGAYIHRDKGNGGGIVSALAIVLIPVFNIVALLFVLDSLVRKLFEAKGK